MLSMPVKRPDPEAVAMDTQDVTSDAGELSDGAAVDGATAGNTGWADVMGRLLAAPPPKKRYVILAKAKKAHPAADDRPEDESEKPAQGPGFEVEGEEKPEAPVKKRVKSAARVRTTKRKDDMEKRRKHREWETMGRVKPDVLDKEKERGLCKIATRGVVQLFNAVRKQQLETDSRLKQAGGSLRKEEQVLQAVSKQEFLERLRGSAAEEGGGRTRQEGGEDASWSVLREDYMPEAGLKDWDRETDEEDADSGSAGDSDDSA